MNKLGNQSIQYGIKGIYSIWIVVYFEGTEHEWKIEIMK